MRKIGFIAWKELYVRFSDRNLMLIMILIPLAISTIIGLAFGGLGDEESPVQNIPIVIVNHDQGADNGMAFGAVFETLLLEDGSEEQDPRSSLPPCELLPGEESDQEAGISLQTLTYAVALDAEKGKQWMENGLAISGGIDLTHTQGLDTLAKAAVEQGWFTAAILIPQDFSQKLSTLTDPQSSLEETGIEVVANGGRPLAAGLVLSIAEGITNQILAGEITIAATLATMDQIGGPGHTAAGAAPGVEEQLLACAFSAGVESITMRSESVSAEQDISLATRILVSVGSAQAMFFALFTGQFGVLSMYHERQEWTLQRLIMSPTPRTSILTGKLLGVFVTVFMQLLLLLLALTIVGSLLQGRLVFIWGKDPLRIGLVLASISFSVSAVGMFLAGVTRSVEQAQIFGYVLNMALAVLGGAFSFTLPRAIAQYSLVYWGRDAFDRLAVGQADVGLHVMVLLGQGVLLYAIGLLLFKDRKSVV